MAATTLLRQGGGWPGRRACAILGFEQTCQRARDGESDMRVLLGSGGYRTPERVGVLATAMRAFFGHVERLLFVPYALRDHDGYVKAMTERGLHDGYELDAIHRHDHPVRAVEEAEAIFIGGGNTFRL